MDRLQRQLGGLQPELLHQLAGGRDAPGDAVRVVGGEQQARLRDVLDRRLAVARGVVAVLWSSAPGVATRPGESPLSPTVTTGFSLWPRPRRYFNWDSLSMAGNCSSGRGRHGGQQ